MPLLDLLRDRLAGRVLDPAPLPPETAAELVEAARWTPSCRNLQPWRFHAVASAHALTRVRAALSPGNRPWTDRAPLLLVAAVRTADDCVTDDGRAYADFDLGMAVTNVLHAATERGLLCRPMAGFDPAAVRAALGLADDVRALVVLAVGRPGDPASVDPEIASRGVGPRTRKPLDQLLVVH